MKKKKKLAKVCALIMALTFIFAGCGKGDAGRYEFYSMTANGETVDAEGLKKTYEALGEDTPEMYIELNEDGTGKIALGIGDTEEITWKKGVITANGEDVKYTIKGGKLTMKKGEEELVFKKVK